MNYRLPECATLLAILLAAQTTSLTTYAKPKSDTQSNPVSSQRPAQVITSGALGSAVLNGKATTQAIGTLNMADALVLFNQNGIAVLSDPSDPLSAAELTGRVFGLQLSDTQSDPNVSGIAFFLKGFSIAALDDHKAEETITLRNGQTVSGRITNLTPLSVTVQDGSKVKNVPTENIANISSPRAFAFSLPITNSGSTAKPEAISFSPNVTPKQPGISTLLPATVMLEGQLEQKHIGKKLFTYSLGAAALTTCFALPIILAVFTPKNTSDINRIIRIVKRNVKDGILEDNKGKLETTSSKPVPVPVPKK
jgi:hypothetical protein